MNLHKLGAAAWQAAQDDEASQRRHEWITAAICAKLLSSRQFRHAAESGLPTEDTASKMAAGYAIYTAIRAQDARRARELRRRYNYRRFLEMGALWTRYESFDADTAAEYMELDLSNAAMCEFIKDRHDPSPQWMRTVEKIYPRIQKLTQDHDGMPDDLRAALETVERIILRIRQD
jgi:muconolactone delta-isomerase